MLKNLTILVLTGALLPACIITDGSTSTDGGTGTGTGTDASAGTDSTGGTDASAGTDSTDGTGSGTGSGDTTATPTTGEPTSTGTTDQGTTDQGTTGTTGASSEYGMCGWSPANYYGCADADGATPGAVDPMGLAPIDCDPAAVEGAD